MENKRKLPVDEVLLQQFEAAQFAPPKHVWFNVEKKIEARNRRMFVVIWIAIAIYFAAIGASRFGLGKLEIGAIKPVSAISAGQKVANESNLSANSQPIVNTNTSNSNSTNGTENPVHPAQNAKTKHGNDNSPIKNAQSLSDFKQEKYLDKLDLNKESGSEKINIPVEPADAQNVAFKPPPFFEWSPAKLKYNFHWKTFLPFITSVLTMKDFEILNPKPKNEDCNFLKSGFFAEIGWGFNSAHYHFEVKNENLKFLHKDISNIQDKMKSSPVKFNSPELNVGYQFVLPKIKTGILINAGFQHSNFSAVNQFEFTTINKPFVVDSINGLIEYIIVKDSQGNPYQFNFDRQLKNEYKITRIPLQLQLSFAIKKRLIIGGGLGMDYVVGNSIRESNLNKYTEFQSLEDSLNHENIRNLSVRSSVFVGYAVNSKISILFSAGSSVMQRSFVAYPNALFFQQLRIRNYGLKVRYTF